MFLWIDGSWDISCWPQYWSFVLHAMEIIGQAQISRRRFQFKIVVLFHQPVHDAHQYVRSPHLCYLAVRRRIWYQRTQRPDNQPQWWLPPRRIGAWAWAVKADTRLLATSLLDFCNDHEKKVGCLCRYYPISVIWLSDGNNLQPVNSSLQVAIGTTWETQFQNFGTIRRSNDYR